MSYLVYDNPALFLGVVGGVQAQDLQAAPSVDALREGLTFRFTLPSGALDLTIDRPADLTGYADLATAAILKPVCLPIALTGFRHSILYAQLRLDPAAHQLAQRVLAATVAS